MTDAITPIPGVVTFDYAAWSARFPTLAQNVPALLAQDCFDDACLILNNTPQSAVQDTNRRGRLLGFLTAHIAQLGLPTSAGGNGAGTVGRVSSASRGSVSISTDTGPVSGSAGWFMQTQYGATFWQMTAWLRQMRISPGMSARPRVWP